MYEERESKRWMYVALILALVLLANGFAMFYITLKPATKATDVSALQKQIDDLETQIRALNIRLENRFYLNQSGNEILTGIYNLTKASVVLIQNRQQTTQGLITASLGSGFIYRVNSQEQYVVSNNHVVEGSSDLLVTFEDGNSSHATVAGTDPDSDLAVIKLASNMPWIQPLALGNSSALKVGERVVAIGSPFGLSGTMTSGIISQLGRDLDATSNFKIVDVIQLDAAINPGNSGGPLVNLLGEVVGMNTAILSESGSSSGVGFAIPSDTIGREAPDLIATGTYKHPYLGVTGIDNGPDIASAAGLNVTYGFLVASVPTNTPASDAKIMGGNTNVVILGQTVTIGGDLIVGVDGLVVKRLNDMSVYLERNRKPGDKITLIIIRGSQKFSVDLILGERPSP
jgi:S1-C subfamily serine protease